jgi:membrane-associated PAP2 superfamily phosphatase
VAAVLVGTFKHFSSHACPWDLAIFGGSAAYHALFGMDAAVPNVDGCFPAAHPLAGYAWLAVGFALYPLSRRRAWQAWLAAFALGTLFGVVQIARGAHFLSHVLWSAWVVWAVNVALLASTPYWPSREREAQATIGPLRGGVREST